VTSSHQAGLGRDVAIYGLSALLVQGGTVLLTPVLTRVLGPSGYGVFELLQVGLSLLSIVLVLGVDLAVVRHYFVGDDLRHQREVISTGLLLIAVTTLIGMSVVLASSGPLADALLGGGTYRGALVAAAVALPLVALMNYTTQTLRIEHRPWHYLMASVIGAVVELVVVIGLVLRTRNVSAVFIGLALGSTATILYALWPSRHLYRPRVSPRLGRTLLRFGMPLVFTGIAGWSVMFIDRLLLTRYVSLAEIGYYGVANKVALVLNLVIYSFGAAWPPMILGLVQRDRPAAAAVRSVTLNQFLVGVGVLGVPAAALAPEVVRVIAGPGYQPAAAAVPVLVLAFLFLATLPVTQIAMLSTDRTRSLVLPSVGAAAVNVVACLVLCPSFGIMGAAWATVAGFSVQAVAYYAIAQHVDRVPYPLGRTVVFFVLVLPFLALGWWHPRFVVGLVVKIPLLVVWAAAVLALRIIDRQAFVGAARSLWAGARADAVRDGWVAE
jgi:O-antigen/teichoic acid export membrane protein